ncbi:MAG: transposase [Methylococcales bacterium]
MRIRAFLRELCWRAGVASVEGHGMPDLVHWCLSIAPKYSMADTVKFLMGKPAIRFQREVLERKRTFGGLHFRAKRFIVSAQLI